MMKQNIKLRSFFYILFLVTTTIVCVTVIGRVGIAAFFYFLNGDFKLSSKEIYIAVKVGLAGGIVGGGGIFILSYFAPKSLKR
ncbi:hypothetical protein [Tatumella sp. UBA2305]|uniref:hypothetical protein n=1 Tax=Tatumella sp. UBA2305 TaxID=1947647 RepID=UPI0025DFAC84|nr:hypothetical protein [Tatumella sp. UBA2305]